MINGGILINEIDSSELERRMAAGEEVYLLDIRTDAEVAQGVLPGARHLPMHLLPMRMGAFPRDQEIVLYCRSGARSYHACAFLLQQGFTNVTNLRSGIIGWVRSGYGIAQGTPR
jgi:rhodanese-related sulfurtransferase